MSELTPEEAKDRLCEAASDYVFGKFTPEFAEQNGGMVQLEQQLISAVRLWEVALGEDQE